MKEIAKNFIVTILSWQVKRLRRQHQFKVVAVVGSIGKTSTKFAVANILSETFRVRYQKGNFNDLVTVPLVFFGAPLPSLFNPLAWVQTFIANERQIRREYPYDVVIVELGTDGPGQIEQFRRFLHADIGVVTAIAPEHMEHFDSLGAVAKEELSLTAFTEKLIINVDLCTADYLHELQNSLSYGIHQKSNYQIHDAVFSKDHFSFSVQKEGQLLLNATNQSVSEVQLYSLLAGVAVADQFGLTADEIVAGIHKIMPVSGRLQLLAGIKQTTIIDDTYNASPDAVTAALDALYALPAPHKIALLGNMNELGDFSADAHHLIGEHCDPKQLDLVVTLGPDADQYLAAAAEAKGCRVIRAASPHQAAEAIKSALKPGAIILAKGSQNGVFAEEAVKELLADSRNVTKLVRQSAAWQKQKSKDFKTVS